MDQKTITLFGGKTVAVIFEDGATGELKVRQFKLREYMALFPFVDDEIELAARACSKARQDILKLSPESYELINAAVREVNEKGFFTFAGRLLERNAVHLKNLPPEILEKMLQRNISSTLSPTIPPPRG